MASREQQIAALEADWASNPRWRGIVRNYSAADVVRWRGSLALEHTLARHGAEKLWDLLHREPFVHALGAVNGDQALQQVKAGLKAIYLSGEPGGTGLVDELGSESEAPLHRAALPALVRRMNRSLQQADQIQWADGNSAIDYFAPIVADGDAVSHDAGLAPYAMTRAMLEAGAAGLHFDDRAPMLHCGPCSGQAGSNGTILLPTRLAIQKLLAARLAADVLGVPTILIGKTDAATAGLLSSDIDALDQPFCTGVRTPEGHYHVRPGIEAALARALAYAPFADLLWCTSAKPDLLFAKRFAEAVHEQFPGKLLAYNCSPSYNWKKHLDDATIARFQKELAAMGYRFQFIASAGVHTLKHGMFHLAHGYARRHMAAFVELQQAEFGAAEKGYGAVKRVRAAAAGYEAAVARSIGQAQEHDQGVGPAAIASTHAAEHMNAQKVA